MPATDGGSILRESPERLAAIACARPARWRSSMFGTPLKNWTKGASSPVTEADIAVDNLLRERLARRGPGFGWLSEETADDPARLAGALCLDRRSDRRHPRLHCRPPDWAVSAALVDDGRPVLAACSLR